MVDLYKVETNRERVSHRSDQFRELEIGKIRLQMKVNDIPMFEKLNPGLNKIICDILESNDSLPIPFKQLLRRKNRTTKLQKLLFKYQITYLLQVEEDASVSL